jgi:N-acyl-D-aspartate/D-glutamate deacylase
MYPERSASAGSRTGDPLVRSGRQRRAFTERLVAITATNPAEHFGLYPQKGTLAVGSDADVVVLDPSDTTTIAVATSPTKVDYGIYAGVSRDHLGPPMVHWRAASATAASSAVKPRTLAWGRRER